MSAPLNILILHRLGDPRHWRTSVRDLEFLLPDHAREHHYVVHGADQPLPHYIKDLHFHAIVLGPTFLCARYARHTFADVLRDYDFIKSSDAFKIAMPQDDYDAHAVLDRWMIDWNVDVVYAACSTHWDLLYPSYSATGRIRQGYTSYIPTTWIDRWKDPVPHRERAIDVSYRARRLPPNFGRIGYLKGVIGERFAAHPATHGLKLDISTDDDALIPGPAWHAFLDNSKCCLATNTGSSVLDPEGDIRRCVEQQLIREPDATFEAVEAHCFPGLDGRYNFTAISPRNLEAALAGTVQIATPGPYGGILTEGDHYISLQPDCSNAVDVVAQMRDQSRIETIRVSARDAVLGVDALRASSHAASLIEQISNGAAVKRVQASSDDAMRAALTRYHEDVITQTDRFWQRRRRRQRWRDALVALGARKIKRWLMRPS